MSSIVLKISSLVIKSLSKPIANRIKQQAREHERFRRVCVKLAQGIHQWDMRFRLGLLQDQAAIDKQIAREAAEAQVKKHQHEGPKTEAQSKADEAFAAKGKEEGTEKVKEAPKKKPKIRPLSEAKAIDSGANFVSESFLLVVAVGCVIGERWYSSKKESSRREDVADRLGELEEYDQHTRKGLLELEKEILRLRAKEGAAQAKRGRILPREVYDVDEKDDDPYEETKGWFSWIRSIGRGRAEIDTKPKPEPGKPKPEAPKEELKVNDASAQEPSPSLYDMIRHPFSTSQSDDSTNQTDAFKNRTEASKSKSKISAAEEEDSKKISAP